jgi:hypothetical protein
VVKRESEDNTPESSGSSSANSEGGTYSTAIEYQSLLDQYRTAALAFDYEVGRLTEIIGAGKDIDKATLASMVAKRVALANAEKTLALCVVVQMQEKNVKEKQQQLERERKTIIDLRKTRKEKEKQLKNNE